MSKKLATILISITGISVNAPQKMPMATPCEPKQLAYLSYWQARGYRFRWDEAAPESTLTPPNHFRSPTKAELIGTAAMLATLFGWLWWLA